MSPLHLRRSLAVTAGNALRLALLALLCASTLACGSSATIHRTSGTTTVGRIASANADTVTVEVGDGQRVSVPRGEIEDIDHPGLAAGLIGTIVGVGALVAAPAGVCGANQEDRLPCIGVLGLSATGLAFGIDGWLTYSRSMTVANSSMPVYDTSYGGAAAGGSPPAGDPADSGADADARARFLGLEPKWAAYQQLRLADVRTLKADLQRKIAATQPLIDGYSEILRLGSADSGIAALTRIGQINADFSRNFLDLPGPPGLDEKQLKQYRTALEDRACPLEEKAIEAWEKALQKAHEFSSSSEYTVEAQSGLNRIRQGVCNTRRRAGP